MRVFFQKRGADLTRSAFGICLVLLMVIAVTLPGANAAEEKYLVPVGQVAGVTVKTQGVLVVEVTAVSDGTAESPAGAAGICAGDIITRIGDTDTTSAELLRAAIAKLDGSDVSVRVQRGKKTLQMTVHPYKNASGECELGLWLRDGMSGIGTITFYDPDTQQFGALGHAVSDADTGVLLPIRSGELMSAGVTDIVPGKAGAPGQILGSFGSEMLGSVKMNCSAGIFGTMQSGEFSKMKALPVADKSEVKTGSAVIVSDVAGGEPEEYEIRITRVADSKSGSRSIMLCVTDERLLALTGGIVQGMSGSPIIQDGKLVGAVTHVLINDPTRGYGILIENMLEAAG